MKNLIIAVMIAAIAIIATDARANNVTPPPIVIGLGTSTSFGATHTDNLAFTDTFTFSISGPISANAALVTIAELPGANIDFTSATLNGNLFTLFTDSPVPGQDVGTISLAAYTGPLTLIVSGTTDAGTVANRTASWAGTLNVLEERPPSVPEPASLMLLGAGLAAIGIWRRKSMKS